uniref:Uncharacterized protein n=1 Tax=Clastoptera arizonana TaxID=38151 RepID=A0A1B6D494_9HEMI
MDSKEIILQVFFKQFLVRHKRIMKLNISNNRFEGGNAMKKLAQGINSSETLKEINLGNNPIKETDAFLFLSDISINSQLRFLDLDYIWVAREFHQLLKEMKNRISLEVRVGGIFDGKDNIVSDIQITLLKRANYLGKKSKKKKRKNNKDFGWFLMHLKLENKLKPIKKSKFEELISQDKINLDPGLSDELARKFQNKKKQVDLPLMLEKYLELYPTTENPTIKTKKKTKKQNVK